MARNPIRSSRLDVAGFLKEVYEIIDDGDFDIDRQFVLIKKNKGDIYYSTPYLMSELDYDVYDIVKTIRELSVKEYSETAVDRDDDKPPLLFVFGKVINKKTVYIKLKVKEKSRKCILCVSFHYSRHEMNYPYA